MIENMPHCLKDEKQMFSLYDYTILIFISIKIPYLSQSSKILPAGNPCSKFSSFTIQNTIFQDPTTLHVTNIALENSHPKKETSIPTSNQPFSCVNCWFQDPTK